MKRTKIPRRRAKAKSELLGRKFKYGRIIYTIQKVENYPDFDIYVVQGGRMFNSRVLKEIGITWLDDPPKEKKELTRRHFSKEIKDAVASLQNDGKELSSSNLHDIARSLIMGDQRMKEYIIHRFFDPENPAMTSDLVHELANYMASLI